MTREIQKAFIKSSEQRVQSMKAVQEKCVPAPSRFWASTPTPSAIRREDPIIRSIQGGMDFDLERFTPNTGEFYKIEARLSSEYTPSFGIFKYPTIGERQSMTIPLRSGKIPHCKAYEASFARMCGAQINCAEVGAMRRTRLLNSTQLSKAARKEVRRFAYMMGVMSKETGFREFVLQEAQNYDLI